MEICSYFTEKQSVIEIMLFVMLVLHQPQVSSCMETTASDTDIPVEVTGHHMQPVIVHETLDPSRYITQSLYQSTHSQRAR